MSQLVLEEGNTSSRRTLSAGESRDRAAANDYVQAKTKVNGITEISGIDALDVGRVKGRGIEGTGEIAANAGNAIAAQAVSDRSPWALMRRPLFRALWLASLTSSIGTWIHEAGAAWLMTSLTLSPVMVALMQTAASLRSEEHTPELQSH